MGQRGGERLTCFKCQKETAYYRVKNRRSYECPRCGYQVYPNAGTPFEGTRTPLRDWFYVMFLFCASRNGVAAKEVQRQLGVTYKTAWRMRNLFGIVERGGDVLTRHVQMRTKAHIIPHVVLSRERKSTRTKARPSDY